MDTDNFSIEVRITNRGKVRGVASIIYLNQEVNGFRLGGFKIMSGNYPTEFTDNDGALLWVAAPSYADPVSGKNINTFYMAENLWKQLQTKILVEYLNKKNKFNSER